MKRQDCIVNVDEVTGLRHTTITDFGHGSLVQAARTLVSYMLSSYSHGHEIDEHAFSLLEREFMRVLGNCTQMHFLHSNADFDTMSLAQIVLLLAGESLASPAQ